MAAKTTRRVSIIKFFAGKDAPMAEKRKLIAEVKMLSPEDIVKLSDMAAVELGVELSD